MGCVELPLECGRTAALFLDHIVSIESVSYDRCILRTGNVSIGCAGLFRVKLSLWQTLDAINKARDDDLRRQLLTLEPPKN